MLKQWPEVWGFSKMKRISIVIVLASVFVQCGCDKPISTATSHTQVLAPDQDDHMGGSFIESSDIRTIAQKFCTEILTLPEINDYPEMVRISTEKIKNSTRYIVDTNLLLRRLRLEMNTYSNGKLRFFAQGSGQIARRRILREQEATRVQAVLDEVALFVANADMVKNAVEPVRISVQPVANTNLFNMNADSFAALLRTKIRSHAGDKVLFTKPGSEAEVDYTLSGQFFAESIMREGVANTTEDLKWAQENPEEWYDDDDEEVKNTVQGNQINVGGVTSSEIKIGPNLTYKVIDPELWYSPNVTKTFNVMLINNEDIAVLEKVVNLETRITSGQENADYILTGDISSLSKALKGSRSDYVLVSLYLIDPVSNELLWEYGYEVKRVTSRSVLYR